MAKEIIKIESFSKSYLDISGHIVNVFENISFNIEIGKITTLLAANGAGKTTLLKMIAGINDDNKNRLFIPQKPSSFPWLNVRENVSFNLKNVSENEVLEIIKFVGLEGYEDHYPHNKSIGFRFRISLARAIINKPELILIDESISSLPLKRRLEFYSLFRKVVAEKGVPILYSTNSVAEAIRVSDKIILFNQFQKGNAEKIILIDEETRIDSEAVLNIQDYFEESELSILFDNII